MTTAVSDILKQVEPLSDQEKLELAARLIEQARPNSQTSLHSLSKQELRNEEGEFELNHMPSSRTYPIRARYKFAGRITPLPYRLEEEG